MYKIVTCDNSFVGTFEQCREWIELDPFSPKKINWEELRTTGKTKLGFPWGDLILEEVK